VCTRWVRLLKALASSMTRIGLPSLHDLGANLIPGDPSGWEPHDRAECPPPFLGHDREGAHYPLADTAFTIGQGAGKGSHATIIGRPADVFEASTTSPAPPTGSVTFDTHVSGTSLRVPSSPTKKHATGGF
jgi:hypothetical protein